MTRRSAFFAAVLLSLLGSTAAAQVQVNVTAPRVPGGTAVSWDPPGTTYGALYISPYSGAITASGVRTSVILNCVDFFHHVTLNSPFWANQTYLSASSLTATRFNNLTWYLQAAWLTQQYGANPGTNANRSIAIQAAIWNIFTGSAPDRLTSNPYGVTDQRYWIAQAQANWHSVNPNQFYVLTATNKDSPGSAQEFLVYNPTTVPEPATLTLMGTGLTGLALARRRRKRTQAT